MNLTTDYFQNLGAALLKQATNVHRNQRHVNMAITFLFSLILARSEYVEAAFLLHRLEQQLRQHIAGRLPRDLITPQKLENVGINISMFLKQYKVPQHLPQQSIFGMYKKPNFALSRHDNKILITSPSRYHLQALR